MHRETTKNARQNAYKQLESLFIRYPKLSGLRDGMLASYDILLDTVTKGRKILICGNGGSCSDSDHIVGELMKSFCAYRPIENELKQKLTELDSEMGARLADGLEGAIPAINLTQHQALSTAYGNDNSAPLVFAQQVYGYGECGDTLIAISTSGNSMNVVLAAITAKAKGLNVIALTGEKESKLSEISDVCINVPEVETYKIQEYHLPIYHTLCLMLEASFWDERRH